MSFGLQRVRASIRRIDAHQDASWPSGRRRFAEGKPAFMLLVARMRRRATQMGKVLAQIP
jgi:hypothetical protein